jgi:hypothetical protein
MTEVRKGSLAALSKEELAAMRQEAKEKREANAQLWASMKLRQDFADEALMKSQFKKYEVRSPDSKEPATVERLAQQLRKAGVSGAEMKEGVGPEWGLPYKKVLQKFLDMNTKDGAQLPLWAAFALVLELCGK